MSVSLFKTITCAFRLLLLQDPSPMVIVTMIKMVRHPMGVSEEGEKEGMTVVWKGNISVIEMEIYILKLK